MGSVAIRIFRISFFYPCLSVKSVYKSNTLWRYSPEGMLIGSLYLPTIPKRPQAYRGSALLGTGVGKMVILITGLSLPEGRSMSR
jgi:hypothetical protein